jgi:ribosomal-protein-alanine N-acetyltransferase
VTPRNNVGVAQTGSMSAQLDILLLKSRAMVYEDLPKVMEIERSAYMFPWNEQIFCDCIRVGYLCRVLEELGTLQGYGVMSVAAGESHLLNLCIDPSAQQRGLGRYLLEHLLDMGRRLGAETIFLEVRSSNDGALRLYLETGFNEVGLRRAYYPSVSGREDALILARTLLDRFP